MLVATPTVGRVRKQSLELALAAGDDARVRTLWTVLQQAGLPSRGDHRSPTNRPHVTLYSAAVIAPEIVERARLMTSRLPAIAQIAGVSFFQHPELAYLAVKLAPDWRAEVSRWSTAAAPDRLWLPHITLSGRLTHDEATRVREILVDVPDQLTFEAITHWDPATGTITRL